MMKYEEFLTLPDAIETKETKCDLAAQCATCRYSLTEYQTLGCPWDAPLAIKCQAKWDR